ncbi:hypothetical protein [Streptomyces sp. NPDC060366]|uniref:hypothetical protein n=1 Tax=Streptomyces sp. NPDC060366 TaxID=3347105 RepID=UPI003660566E
MAKPTKVYGVWEPVKTEPANGVAWMEWWPSMRAAHQSMRNRIPQGFGLPNVDPARHVTRPDRDDAQWYGSEDQCVIFLYETPDSDQPYATLEFGPRGGIRQRDLTTAGA